MTPEWCCYFCNCEVETTTVITPFSATTKYSSSTMESKSSPKPQIYFTRKIKPLPLFQYKGSVSIGSSTTYTPPPPTSNLEKSNSNLTNTFETILIVLLIVAVFVLISLSIIAYKFSNRKSKKVNNEIEMSDFSLSRDKDNTIYRSLTHDKKGKIKVKENNKHMADTNRTAYFSQPQCLPSIIKTNEKDKREMSKHTKKIHNLNNEKLSKLKKEDEKKNMLEKNCKSYDLCKQRTRNVSI